MRDGAAGRSEAGREEAEVKRAFAAGFGLGVLVGALGLTAFAWWGPDVIIWDCRVDSSAPTDGAGKE